MDEEYFERFMSYEILTDLLITNTDRHVRIDDTWSLFERKANLVYTFQRRKRSA